MSSNSSLLFIGLDQTTLIIVIAVPIGAVVVLAVIALLVIFLTPSIKAKIFPYANRERHQMTRTS